MYITSDKLCSSCRGIHPRTNDGDLFDFTIGDHLDKSIQAIPRSENAAFQCAFAYMFTKGYLEDNGGCARCIALFN